MCQVRPGLRCSPESRAALENAYLAYRGDVGVQPLGPGQAEYGQVPDKAHDQHIVSEAAVGTQYVGLDSPMLERYHDRKSQVAKVQATFEPLDEPSRRERRAFKAQARLERATAQLENAREAVAALGASALGGMAAPLVLPVVAGYALSAKVDQQLAKMLIRRSGEGMEERRREVARALYQRKAAFRTSAQAVEAVDHAKLKAHLIDRRGKLPVKLEVSPAVVDEARATFLAAEQEYEEARAVAEKYGFKQPSINPFVDESREADTFFAYPSQYRARPEWVSAKPEVELPRFPE